MRLMESTRRRLTPASVFLLCSHESRHRRRLRIIVSVALAMVPRSTRRRYSEKLTLVSDTAKDEIADSVPGAFCRASSLQSARPNTVLRWARTSLRAGASTANDLSSPRPIPTRDCGGVSQKAHRWQRRMPGS
jgi:hypothetical protein